jgi:hypothetical protein
MKTLNIALLSVALVAGAGSAAFAVDGPHNRDVTSVSYSDSFQDQAATAPNGQIDQQSQATLDLNLRGENASRHH